MSLTTTPKPYTTAIESIGILEEQEVAVAYMPRADFMELFEEVARQIVAFHVAPGDVAGAEAEIDELREVARSMPRFPLGDWVTNRGCGCVIGEYLVVHDIVTRKDAARHVTNVSAILRTLPFGGMLDRFGVEIDAAVGARIDNEGATWVEADETDWARAVRAVIFLDEETS